jgi:hypothetical protein
MSPMPVRSRLREHIEVEGAEYFIVTALRDLELQPELDAILRNEYELVAATKDYVVFDLRVTRPHDQSFPK